MALSLLCVSPIPVAAQVTESDGQGYFYAEGEGARLISVEYIPDDQSETAIPSEVIDAFGILSGDQSIETHGTKIPNTKEPYDLSIGKESILLSQSTVYYSDHVYIGHGGKVTMSIKETSGTVVTDEFLVKIFVRNWNGTGTTKATLAVERNTARAVTLNATVSESAKVYYVIDPQENGEVNLGALNNYIAKG